MKLFVKNVNDFQPLAFLQKELSSMFNWAVNTTLCVVYVLLIISKPFHSA